MDTVTLMRAFGDLAVDDAIAAQLVALRVARGDQHIVRVRFGGQLHVGAARVGLGRGVGMVEDDGHLIGVVQCSPHYELLVGVETVERRRALRIGHRDVAFGAVGSFRPGQ
jgi:hypothetical protein